MELKFHFQKLKFKFCFGMTRLRYAVQIILSKFFFFFCYQLYAVTKTDVVYGYLIQQSCCIVVATVLDYAPLT